MTDQSAELRIISLERSDEDYLDQVEVLFERMYSELYEFSSIIPLAPDGARIWRKSITPTLGRLAVVLAAIDPSGRVIAFVHLSLIFLPDYLGGGRAARLHNIFVDNAMRGTGVAVRLVEAVREWVQQKGAESIEVQVQVGNERSIALWKRLGFAPELLQLRLVLE